MSRLLVLVVVLAACGRVTTSQPMSDAGLVDPRLPDAALDAPPDAYARRPCDAPAPFFEGLAPSRVLHVSPGAVGGDGSSEEPFGSIAAAAAVATPGTFIELAPGMHKPEQFVPNLRGTAAAPIWIGGAPGTRPILWGGSEALHLTRPAYVVVQNLELRNQSVNGINIDDGVAQAGDTHHVVLTNIVAHEVTATGGRCLKAAGVDQLSIYDSAFRRCGIGVDLIGVHDSVVARNEVSESTYASMQARGGSTDIDIRQNRVRDSSASGITLGGSTSLSSFRPPPSTMTPNAEARRIRAFDNVVLGFTGVPFSFNGCIDCLVAHNLTWGNPTRLIDIVLDSAAQGSYTFEPTSNGRVINNTFLWTSSIGPHVLVGSSTAATTFTFSHNNWFYSSIPSDSTPSLPVTESGSLVGVGTGYRLSGNTLLVYCDGPEKGAALSLPDVDGTIEGYCRASGDAPTIGPQIATLSACDL